MGCLFSGGTWRERRATSCQSDHSELLFDEEDVLFKQHQRADNGNILSVIVAHRCPFPPFIDCLGVLHRSHHFYRQLYRALIADFLKSGFMWWKRGSMSCSAVELRSSISWNSVANCGKLWLIVVVMKKHAVARTWLSEWCYLYYHYSFIMVILFERLWFGVGIVRQSYSVSHSADAFQVVCMMTFIFNKSEGSKHNKMNVEIW